MQIRYRTSMVWGIILMAAGFLVLAAVSYVYARQSQESQNFADIPTMTYEQHQRLNALQKEPNAGLAQEQDEERSAESQEGMEKKHPPVLHQFLELSEWDPSREKLPEAIGQLTIPSIDLEVPVLFGTTEGNLKKGAGMVPEAKFPGEPGNSAFSAHRSWIYGSKFNRLEELKPGDLIIYEDKKYKYRYVVYEAFKVMPENTWVLGDVEGKNTITLITCWPLYGNSKRLIVRGEMVYNKNAVARDVTDHPGDTEVAAAIYQPRWNWLGSYGFEQVYDPRRVYSQTAITNGVVRIKVIPEERRRKVEMLLEKYLNTFPRDYVKENIQMLELYDRYTLEGRRLIGYGYRGNIRISYGDIAINEEADFLRLAAYSFFFSRALPMQAGSPFEEFFTALEELNIEYAVPTMDFVYPDIAFIQTGDIKPGSKAVDEKELERGIPDPFAYKSVIHHGAAVAALVELGRYPEYARFENLRRVMDVYIHCMHRIRPELDEDYYTRVLPERYK